MPVRERHAGFYTVAMVKAGHVDQWAAIRSYGRVTIELRYDGVRDLFLVTEVVDSGDDYNTRAVRESAFRFLADAHHDFTELTRFHM